MSKYYKIKCKGCKKIKKCRGKIFCSKICELGTKSIIRGNKKRCSKCKVYKRFANFYKKADWCKDCRKEYGIVNASKDRDRKQAQKKIIIEHYGGKCNCCPETNFKFLTIDHINNDGYKQKKMSYSLIIKNNFPSDLQILCWNCNCGRSKNNGICPHKDEKNM